MSKIIKCMFFVLLAAVLPLSVHAQQVTLHLQDVTVRKAFRELEEIRKDPSHRTHEDADELFAALGI